MALTLSYVPLIAILLLNLFIVGWVLRQRDRTRSGFFLLVNCLSLVLWAGGQALFKLVGQAAPWVLSLPYLAALLVPANLLYYGLTRPVPIREMWRGPILIAIIFIPALILTLFESYSVELEPFFSYSYRTDRFSSDNLPMRLTQIYVLILLVSAIAVMGIRYYTSTGPEQNTSKHLIASILGPLMFAGFFWGGSQGGGAAILPSPSFLLAIMGQVALFVVLRQEELRQPKTLARTVYYVMAVLIAFVFAHLIQEFYIVVQGGIVLERTAGWLVIGSILAFLLLARVGHFERLFDKLMFARAAEYRQIVEETRHELKEARERLRKAERLSVVGEIAARVAHEIKNPLGPIRGYTQMMREKLEKTEAFEEREKFLNYLEVIQEEVDNIDRHVRDLLERSRQPQLIIETVDVNKLVRRCARVMRLELSAGREMSGLLLPVAIEAEVDPQLEPIRADGSRLEEAIFNLARNALDAMVDRTRGRITISAKRKAGNNGEDGVSIVVSDNGPGFRAAEIDQHFESFFSQKSEGTGLGLAIVKGTVEAHGGAISLKNREWGGGEVQLWIPRIAKENPGALLPKASTENRNEMPG